MAKQGKLVITTGNGSTTILASANAPTGGLSQPSQTPTSIEGGSTKPRSLAEALSLLQTQLFDLRSIGCNVSILARKNRIYVIAEMPAKTDYLRMEDGHIILNDRPVILA